MENNDLLRRLRYALQIDDAEAARLVGLGGELSNAALMASFRSRGSDADDVACPDAIVAALLSGLVIDRRGPPPVDAAVAPDRAIDNNTVLKRVKTALQLRSEDVRDCIVAGGGDASLSEVGAFLRRPGNRNFRGLGDQVLRRFLTGLARARRPAQAEPSSREEDPS